LAVFRVVFLVFRSVRTQVVQTRSTISPHGAGRAPGRRTWGHIGAPASAIIAEEPLIEELAIQLLDMGVLAPHDIG